MSAVLITMWGLLFIILTFFLIKIGSRNMLTDRVQKRKIGRKIESISEWLQIDPKWLVSVIYFESKFLPMAQNKFTKATGLIQFMPETAKQLGTDITVLAKMDIDKQLDYVFQYYKPYRGLISSLTDCYLAVFFPAAIGKGDDYVFKLPKISAEKIASQNKIFDINKNKEITKGELTNFFVSWCKTNNKWLNEYL